MTFKTLPNSWTALPSTAEAAVPGQPVLVTEATSGQQAQADPNASMPRRREGSRHASTWLSRVSLACHLAMREVELANWPSTYYVQLVSEENATGTYLKSPQEAARQEILSRIGRIPPEDLEDGMTYELGMNVVSVVNRYHELALTTLAESIFGGEISSELASHTLRWLGRIKDPATESSRLRILNRSLRAVSPLVRDGAALGLAALGKREAIPMLRKALEDEPIVSLRRDLEQVLRELD